MFQNYFEGLKDPATRINPNPTPLFEPSPTMGEAAAYSAKESEQSIDPMGKAARSIGPSPYIQTRNTKGQIIDVSTAYDKVFTRHADKLPLSFIRALSARESSLNPAEKGGIHWGILQVGKKNVLPSYNKRMGTSYTEEDLFDPNINSQIALELINRIARNYEELAGDSPLMANMRADFRNPEFVKLLVAGWNSGYSRKAGVQYVAKWLANRGIPVTHNAIFANAEKAGATKWLRGTVTDDPNKIQRRKRWQASVSHWFFNMQDYTPIPPSESPGKSPKRRSGFGALAALAIALPLGLIALTR